ncbi:hypothetical protein NHQ30_011100 [Ciborinia camelliae]|nr:hypothetical protein NHQ30_011100 [Ciborinia camelliae]
MAAIPDDNPEKELVEFSSNVQPTDKPLNVGEPSDVEKIYLAAYEGHDADIASNEGYILDAQEEIKRKQNIALHRQASKALDAQAQTNGDVEKLSQENDTEDVDPNIVGWDGPDDPENPMNWKGWMKFFNCFLVSAICFVTPLASSMFAPGVPALMEEFHSTNSELAGFVVSVYVLGFAFGPLFLAPLSEIYGRLPIYHICNSLFICFSVACALATNLNMLVGFRFLAGVWGSAVLTNGGGTITDLMRQEKRGFAMSAYSMGPVIGPIIGPVAGGFLAEAKGWRWIFWVLAMVSGCFTILGFIFLRETYAVTILQRKTVRLRKQTSNLALVSKLDLGLSPQDFFRRGIVRPAKLMVRSPIVLSTAIYMGVVYGYIYLLFTTFTLVFEETYGFSSGLVGLTYLGLGIGSMFGLGLFAYFSDRMMKSSTIKANATATGAGPETPGMKPEYRLQLLVPGSFLIPIGLLLYGWTAKYKVHWIVPILSTTITGVGNIFVFMGISMYLVDAFTIYAASALAANTVFRSVMGAVLPLAGQKMYETLGLGWGNSLLAFIAIGLIPVPFALLRWGEYIRTKYPVKNL